MSGYVTDVQWLLGLSGKPGGAWASLDFSKGYAALKESVPSAFVDLAEIVGLDPVRQWSQVYKAMHGRRRVTLLQAMRVRAYFLRHGVEDFLGGAYPTKRNE